MKKSANKIPDNFNREKFSDLTARLKKYDEKSGSYKLDFTAVPSAIRMVLRIFPRKFCHNKLLKERILRAFVTTIIPGADENDPDLVRMYNDDYYPFSSYCGYFVFDIHKKSTRLFPGREFSDLSLKERTAVVQNALAGNELSRRLYKGAILMAQVSFYGAVYNEEKGCSLISFPGRNQGYSKKDTTYKFAESFFDFELSPDGHPW